MAAEVFDMVEGGVVDVTHHRWLSWDELSRRRATIGRLLVKSQHEDSPSFVVIRSSSGFLLAVAELSCAAIGVPFCPINPDDPPHRVGTIRRLLGSSVVVDDADINAALSHTVEVDDAANNDTARQYTARTIDDTLPVYGIGTSGTTGEPKLVLVEYRHLNAYVSAMISALDFTSSSRIAMVSGPTFDPSIGDIFTAFSLRATLLVGDRTHITLDPTAFLCRARPTHVVASPALWQHVDLQQLWVVYKSVNNSGGSKLPCTIVLGGERMPSQLRHDSAALVDRFGNIYGVTECVGYQALSWIDTSYSWGMTSMVDVGPAIGANEIALLRLDADEILPESDNQEGELAVRGPQLSRGYIGHNPLGSSWFRTGDVAVRVVHGEATVGYHLVGRRDLQVKLCGQRISMEEIEFTMSEALAESTIALVSSIACLHMHLPNGAALVGVVVLVPDEHLTSNNTTTSRARSDRAEHQLVEAVLRHVAAVRLSPAQRPCRWVILRGPREAFPVTSNDKLDRVALASWCAARLTAEQEATGDVEVAEPLSVLSGVEVAVRGIWQALLNVADIRPTTSFVACGGDSMLALRACQLLRRVVTTPALSLSEEDPYGKLSGPLSPAQLMRHPTLRDYALYLVAAGVSASDTSTDLGLAKNRSVSSQPSQLQPEEMLLLELVRAGMYGGVATLVQCAGVDINSGSRRSTQRTSPLHLAASSGDARMIEELAKLGAKLTSFDQHHVTPLHLAAQSSVDAVKALVTLGAPLGARDARGQGMLHHAARVGNLPVVRYLAEDLAQPLDARDRWQRTPLHWAVLNAHIAVVQYLVNQITSSDSVNSWRRPRAVSQRLARTRTHLVYETPPELALREHGKESEIFHICSVLSDWEE